MLNQLKKAEIDNRLINIVRAFFSAKANSTLSSDRDNLRKLAVDIQEALNEHHGRTQRVILLQRFIMYGVNDPQLVSYYFDIFTKLAETYDHKAQKKLVSYLLLQTEVPSYHSFYPDQPTLGEAIQTRLQAWMNHLNESEHDFELPGDDDTRPLIKFLHYPFVVMKLIRLMIEAKIIKRTVNIAPFYDSMSRTIISPEGKKYEPRTLENGYEYRDAEDIQTVIDLLDKMKALAKKKRDEILSKWSPWGQAYTQAQIPRTAAGLKSGVFRKALLLSEA